MRYCPLCVQPDTRPGIVFGDDGTCPACKFARLNRTVDWAARREELQVLADHARRSSSSGYDCIVTVSGGKDSVRQALYVRDELSLKPLLVSCSYPPEQISERGAFNLENLISQGFDTLSVSPDPRTWKALMRAGFLRYGNWCRSTELALYATGPRVAIAYGIPVVFYGENPALALGELCDGYTVSGDGNTMKYSSNTLNGGNMDGLLDEGIGEQDLIAYRYPGDEEIRAAGLRMIYLGYYVQDFNRFRNGEIAIASGLRIRDDAPENTGMVYPWEALDEDFVIVNQMIKHIKFGFGFTTEQVLEGIRLGLYSRDEAIEMVRKYDGRCSDSYVERFCEYLGITKNEFWAVAESYRDAGIWRRTESGQWTLRVDPGSQ